MTPYTADAQVISSILTDTHNSLWKELSGSIKSILILEKNVIEQGSESHNLSHIYKVVLTTEVLTTEVLESPSTETKSIHLKVEVEWDFMILKKVEILDLTVK